MPRIVSQFEGPKSSESTTGDGEFIKDRLLFHTCPDKTRPAKRGTTYTWSASALDDNSARFVASCRFVDIHPTCKSIEMPIDNGWNELLRGVATIQLDPTGKTGFFFVKFC